MRQENTETVPAMWMSENVTAYVVFTAQADWPWLKILKPGYRHCFVLLHDGDTWLSLDPLLNHTDMQVHRVPPGFDLPGWLKERGHRVVRAHIDRSHSRPAPFAPYTCVEAVKRVLGLHDWRILTPWQLYKHLRNLPPVAQRGHVPSSGTCPWTAKTGDTYFLTKVHVPFGGKTKGDLAWEA